MEVRRTLSIESARRAPEIQIPVQYAADFAREARHAKDRVWVQCMDFEMTHPSGPIQNALKEAGQRNLDSRLVMDGFATAMINDKIGWVSTATRKTYDVIRHVPFVGKDFQQGTARVQNLNQRIVEQEVTRVADQDMLAGMESSGVQVIITNPKVAKIIPAELFPFIGRNHMKISIVDNIAWFGGVNAASDHFEKADFMVKISDPEVVEALAGIFPQVNENRPRSDFKKEINANYTVLVDRGDRGKSIILDEALHMIAEAKESIGYISQLPPAGKVLDALIKSAQEGKLVEVVTQAEEHFNSNSIPFGLLMKRSYQKFLREARKYSNIHRYHFTQHHGMVHAKMLITDAETDSAKALWGSHNLHESGVKVGTQEVSMLTTDHRLVAKLVTVYDQIKNGIYDLGYLEGRLNPQGFDEFSL